MLDTTKPAQELMISLNILFPDALSSGKAPEYTGEVTERLREVISAELCRLGINHEHEAAHFLYLGTELIPDSFRCSECSIWVILHKGAWRRTSAITSGERIPDRRVVCENCIDHLV